MTPVNFGEYLARRGFLFSTMILSGKQVHVIDAYTVPHGRHAGRTVGIGLPIPPDFPITAPYGLHVRNDHGLGAGMPAVNASGLGTAWSFWSREIKGWNSGDPRAADLYMDHVDRWLEVE